MLKIKIKATGQIIEVKDFSRIIIDEENEEIRELSLNEVELIEEDEEDEKHRDMIASVNGFVILLIVGILLIVAK